MKAVILRVVFGTILLAIGFAAGRVYQYAKNGYIYQLSAEHEYPFPLGPVHWRYVWESVGAFKNDPGTEVITLRDMTIYKARRTREGPFDSTVVTSNKSIIWTDRGLRFDLAIEPIENGERGSAANRSQPATPQKNRTSAAAGSGR
jgi:hypothetical protein